MRAWTDEFDDSATVRGDLVTRLNTALAAAGIEIPFPQRDITVRAVTPEALRMPPPPGGASLDAEQPKEPS